MQYSTHKSLTAYIRELYAPLLILPAVILLLSGVLLFIIPQERRHATAVDSFAEAVSDEAYAGRAITLHADALYYTGLDLEYGSRVRSRIYYTLEDGTCYYVILTKTKANAAAEVLTDQTLTVALLSNDSMFEVICASMSEDLQFSLENLKAMSCDILFSQYEYKNGFISFTVYALHILFVFAAAGFIYCLLVLIHPAASLCVRRLRHYGNASSLFAIAVTEFDTATPVGRRNLYVTDSFFIILLPRDIIIQPLSDIVWIYQTHEVQHTHGHARMVHTLCIVNRRKQTHRIHRLSEPVIATLINAIASGRPEIQIGNADAFGHST